MCVKCERRCVLCQVNAQDPWEGAAGTPAGEQDMGLWGVALSTTAGHAPVPKAEEGPSLQVCASLCASDQSLFSIFSNPSHSCVVLARDLVGLSAWRRFSAAGCKLPLPHFLSSLAPPRFSAPYRGCVPCVWPVVEHTRHGGGERPLDWG